MSAERTMTTEEAIIFLTDQLDDETQRSESYRDAAIALLDEMAEKAVVIKQAERKRRREQEDEIMNAYPPSSNSTH